ncbi:MAG: hypothetical protein IPI71_00080 [Methanolinea sp.]|nr:MAG: hypothetical protein IPI71_00080 [Methanolinea sp.]
MVGGFHLIDRATPPELVRSTGEGPAAAGCGRVITGHCTGNDAKTALKKVLGHRFTALYTGYSTEI